ncbi:hypothetical protein Tco_0603436 [Tanacetum coccineum]
MADNDWQKVTRKKHISVFQRLKFPTPGTSRAYDVAKISHWCMCPISLRIFLLENYGIFVVRYIKVSNQENLINSLSNVWIGKLCLYANVARLDRKMDGKSSQLGLYAMKTAHASPMATPDNMTSSYVNVAKGSSKPKSTDDDSEMHKPTIILS